MPQAKKRSIGSAVTYFTLALFFLGLSWSIANPVNRFRLHYPIGSFPKFFEMFFLILFFVYTVAFVIAALRVLHSVRPFHGTLGKWFKSERGLNLSMMIAWIRARAQDVRFRLVLWGAGVLLFTILLSVRGYLNDLHFWFYQRLIDRSLYYPAYDRTKSQVPSPMIDVELHTGTDDGELYLKSCLQITNDLKRNGVKAVLIDLRDVPSTSGTQKHLHSINELGIAIFGINPWGQLTALDMSSLDKYAYFTMSHFSSWRAVLPRISMAQFYDSQQRIGYDVALELVRQLQDHPDSTSIRGKVKPFGLAHTRFRHWMT